MKKVFVNRENLNRLLVCLLLLAVPCGLVLFSLWHPARLRFDRPVSYIEVRHEDEIRTLTDRDEVDSLVEQFNDWDLRRGERIEPYSGWSVMLDVYLEGREEPVRLTFHGEGFDYRNYLYSPRGGEETGTVENDLLALFG